MSQIYNLHFNPGESCHQYEAAGKVHQVPRSCCRDWLGKVFFLAGYFFLFKYYGCAHLMQVGKWPEHNFRRSWSSLCGGGLAGLPCLVVWPCGCRPGGTLQLLQKLTALWKQEVPGRQLLIDRLLWTSNGSDTQWPRVAGGRPSDTQQPAPGQFPTVVVL